MNSNKPDPPSRLAMGFYYPSISSASSQTDIKISLTYWLQELTTSLKLDKVYSVLYKDIKTMSQDFSDKKLDMIIAPPLLLSLYFDRSIMSDGFIGVQEIGKTDHLVIISNHSQNKSFPGFQGKRLVLPTNDVLAKMFLNTEIIKQYNKPYQAIFSQISHSNKSQRMILDVFFNKADIAVVYENMFNIMLEMNPQLSKRIKIISEFPVRSRNYSYFHKNYKYIQALQEGSTKVSKNIRGQQILEVFHTSQIDKCLVSDLDQFDRLIETNKNLNKSIGNE
ncbi:MAG: PhnD/SsuA/transferrin family substrate-binding protein [Methylococcales bacterium]